MLLLHRTVSLLLLVCAAYCTEPDVCSNDGVFLGIARDREDIINKRTVMLQTMQPTNCDAGVRCRKCWTILLSGFFSKWERSIRFINCGDSYVLLFKHLERAYYKDLLSLVSWIYGKFIQIARRVYTVFTSMCIMIISHICLPHKCFFCFCMYSF